MTNRWRGKTAVVTGAAAGIGAGIADILLEEGMNVVALDVQYDRLNTKKSLMKIVTDKEDKSENFYPIKCDLTKEIEIIEAFDWIKENLGGIDVLVNNAGMTHYSKIIESETDVFRKMLDLDVLAVAICTREAIASMRAREVEGHVFNVNSILGHEIPTEIFHNGWNLYPSCKHATVAMTSLVRRELVDVKSKKIRITSISPGLVKTEITSNTPELKDFFERVPALLPSDIAEAVLYALKSRPEVQITEITIRRTGES